MSLSTNEKAECHRATGIGFGHQGKGLDEAARWSVSKINQPVQLQALRHSEAVSPRRCDVFGNVDGCLDLEVRGTHPLHILVERVEGCAQHRSSNLRD